MELAVDSVSNAVSNVTASKTQSSSSTVNHHHYYTNVTKNNDNDRFLLPHAHNVSGATNWSRVVQEMGEVVDAKGVARFVVFEEKIERKWNETLEEMKRLEQENGAWKNETMEMLMKNQREKQDLENERIRGQELKWTQSLSFLEQNMMLVTNNLQSTTETNITFLTSSLSTVVSNVETLRSDAEDSLTSAVGKWEESQEVELVLKSEMEERWLNNLTNSEARMNAAMSSLLVERDISSARSWSTATEERRDLAQNLSSVATAAVARAALIDASLLSTSALAEAMATVLRERMVMGMELVGQDVCVAGADCHYSVQGVEVSDLISFGDACGNRSRSDEGVYSVGSGMVVQRATKEEEQSSGAVPVCHSRGLTSPLFTRLTRQLGRSLKVRAPPLLASSRVGHGSHHNDESVVTGAIKVDLHFVRADIEHELSVGMTLATNYGCQGIIHESKFNVTNTTMSFPSSHLPPGEYVFCATTSTSTTTTTTTSPSSYVRQPTRLRVIRPHVAAMVARHQLVSSSLRIAVSFARPGDHLAFVPKDAIGCEGAAVNSLNLTRGSILGTIPSSYSSRKLCYAPTFGIWGVPLSDNNFFDEGLVITPTMEVSELSLLPASVEVSPSSISFVAGGDISGGAVTMYATDYLNGRIQIVTRTPTPTDSTTTTTTTFADGLNQIMSIHVDSTTGDVFVVQLHPETVTRIPSNHPSNPAVFAKVNLDISPPLPNQEEGGEEGSPIDMARDDVNGGIYLLLRGERGKVVRLTPRENDVDAYDRVDWMPLNNTLYLPGTSDETLGGGIAIDEHWIYVSEHGTGGVRRISRGDDKTMKFIVPAGKFSIPFGLTMTVRGNLLVADLYGNAVYVVRQPGAEDGGAAVVVELLSWQLLICTTRDRLRIRVVDECLSQR